ncbi:MAG: hypothetical protein O3A46_08055 [Candidatus Poribacteria bacterium]|nr:hypothetical protein [Candidatus Poribacteria bacterium]
MRRRWMLIALWITAIAALLVAELGIRRESRTTYDTPATGRVAEPERARQADFRPLAIARSNHESRHIQRS